jgi:hypothetical protein
MNLAGLKASRLMINQAAMIGFGLDVTMLI